MAQRTSQRLSCACLPDTGGGVQGSSDELSGVVAEAGRNNMIVVQRSHRGEQPAALGVEDHNGSAGYRRGDKLAIRSEFHRSKFALGCKRSVAEISPHLSSW